jgi:ketosteroid isomerase-like protein
VETPRTQSGPGAVVERLLQATNDHDIDALVSCFAMDYRNETPTHPDRGFMGRAQVQRNWDQMFAAVPDLSADVTWIADDTAVWSEWEMRGTRRDGKPHLLRGVVIFGVEDGEATWARFYLEPVEIEGPDADEALRQTLNRSGAEGKSGSARATGPDAPETRS